ncbi:MAG: helix-turn-helix domain-containing protein, partial [Acidimicrobiales bacterium]
MADYEWLTAGDLAEQMRVTRQQVNAMAARGDLPGVKFGRFWRFRADLFEQWVERRINPDPRAR